VEQERETLPGKGKDQSNSTQEPIQYVDHRRIGSDNSCPEYVSDVCLVTAVSEAGAVMCFLDTHWVCRLAWHIGGYDVDTATLTPSCLSMFNICKKMENR
jgi:hypothetical protein